MSTSTKQVQYKSKQEEIKALREEEKKLCDKVKLADSSLKSTIQRHAEVLERLYQLGEYADAISTISTTITRKYREMGIKAAEHVSRYLPDRFKDQSRDTSQYQPSSLGGGMEQSSIRLGPDGSNLPEQLSTFHHDPTEYAKLTEDWKSLSRRQKQDLPERLTDLEAKQEEVLETIHRAKLEAEAMCTEEKIPFMRKEDANQSTFDAINAQKKDRDPITISRPVPKETVLSDAIEHFIKAMIILKKNVIQFPPEIKEDAEEYAAAFNEITAFFAPMLDLKWRKDNYAWLKIELDRGNFGKHASAVKNFTKTLSCTQCNSEMYRTNQVADVWTCENCSNDSKGKRKVLNAQPVCGRCHGPIARIPFTGWECPSCHNTKGQRRNLTREQVGDKSVEVVEAAKRMVEHIPWFFKLCFYYRSYIEPRAGDRSVRLGPELSNMA